MMPTADNTVVCLKLGRVVIFECLTTKKQRDMQSDRCFID